MPDSIIEQRRRGVGSMAVPVPIGKPPGTKIYTTARAANFDYVHSCGAELPVLEFELGLPNLSSIPGSTD